MGVEMLYVASPNLGKAGIAHGFSLRQGGVSKAPFDSLDFGRTTSDAAAIEENHRRLAHALGYAPDRLYETTQVHGDAVRVITASDVPSRARGENADALVSNVSGVSLAVRVADCLPLLLADPQARVVAAVHAGWRGAAANIVDRALDAMLALGATMANMHAATGPHIRECCFEVGEEVVEGLEAVAHGAPFVVREPGRKPHVKLAAVVHAQLAARGLEVARIDDVPGCTRCDALSFYSFRRDGASSGRHLAVVTVK